MIVLQISPYEICEQVQPIVDSYPEYEGQLRVEVAHGKCYLSEMVPTMQYAECGVGQIEDVAWIICEVTAQNLGEIPALIQANRKSFLGQNPYEWLVKAEEERVTKAKEDAADKFRYEARDYLRFLNNPLFSGVGKNLDKTRG